VVLDFAGGCEQPGQRDWLQAMENWAMKINAKISINSTPGKGTRIEVLVPREEVTQ